MRAPCTCWPGATPASPGASKPTWPSPTSSPPHPPSNCGIDVTGVVNWRPVGHDPAAVRARLRDAWISLADIAGDSWFRSVAANPLANPEPVVTAVLNALDPS